MKKCLFILCFILMTDQLFATVDIRKPDNGFPAKWSETECDTPESVYFDMETNQLFISNIAGKGDEKDGNGWISVASVDGKMKTAKWITGLNAPKGLRAFRGKLFVSDIDAIVSIDVKTGMIKDKVNVPGAKFLNDVAVDRDGAVYVSDTLSSKIYKMVDGKVSVFVEGPQWESPNGLLVHGSKLVVASWGLTTDFSTKTPGHLYSIDLKTKKKKMITKNVLGNLDGLEEDYEGNYLVSDWVAGTIMRVDSKGKSELLMEGFQGSADLAYIAPSKTLVIPRMKENQITAYDLAKFPRQLSN